MERFSSEKTREINELTKILQEKRLKSKELETKRNNFQEKIDDKENNLKTYDDQISDVSIMNEMSEINFF